MRKAAFYPLLAALSLPAACNPALTAEEAREALDEIAVSSQARPISRWYSTPRPSR